MPKLLVVYLFTDFWGIANRLAICSSQWEMNDLFIQGKKTIRIIHLAETEEYFPLGILLLVYTKVKTFFHNKADKQARIILVQTSSFLLPWESEPMRHLASEECFL